METLGSLLQIEQDVRQATSENAVEFIAVNDTWRLLPYRQAVLWRQNSNSPLKITAISGLADLSSDSPYLQWLNQAIRHCHAQLTPGKTQLLSKTDLPESLHPGWQEWMPLYALLISLPTPQGQTIGGLWLALEYTPQAAELALIERLAWSYGQALWAWRDQITLWQASLNQLKKQGRNKYIWLGLLAISLCPLRLTVLAPAEVIGKDAKLITAPMDGVVAKFLVQPNQMVKAGEVLFTLDDTTFRNRYEVAEKSRAVAQADYLRATQKAFSSEESKAELSSLRAKFEEKTAEAQYNKDLAQRIQVSAPEAGLLVYSDPNDWLGRPVQTGERIAQLADPKRVQIAINLPVDDALNLEQGAQVKIYLNIAPLSTLDGNLTQVSYEPVPTPEGIVAYKLKADLNDNNTPPRIGLKGSAKIYGNWAPLIYQVFRKPLAALRRAVGV